MNNVFRRAVMGLMVLVGTGPALALDVEPDELSVLRDRCRRHGYAAVVLDLDRTARPVGALPAALRASRVARAEAIASALKADHLGGLEVSDLGMASMYLSCAGVEALAGIAGQEGASWDGGRSMARRVAMLDRAREKVEASLRAAGRVTLEILLNGDDFAYTLRPDGVRYVWQPGGDRPSPALASSLMQRHAGLSRVDASRVRALGAAFAPIVVADVDLRTYLALVEDDAVRSIRPVGFVDDRAQILDAFPPGLAPSPDPVEVTIVLRGDWVLAAASSRLPRRALQAQARANAAAFQEILAVAGQDMPDDGSASLDLGFLRLRIGQIPLRKIVDRRDPRILSIRYNRPML